MASRDAPLYRRSPVRIGCVQYDAKFKEVQINVAKIQEMTKRIPPNSLDLLVLPEMATSGYMFPSAEAIEPFLEPARIGPTSLLCRDLAKRLNCHVVAGYPERIPEEELGAIQDGKQGWNSAMLVDPTGQVIGNYRKTFLYYTDQTWAREGDGFQVYDLPQPLGRVAIGICMDMNPKDFIAPFDAYELSSFVRREKADMLVVPMNWLQPPDEPSEGSAPPPLSENDGPEESTLNYWAHRLMPLHDPAPTFSMNSGEPEAAVTADKEVIFVACNRVGLEKGTTFVGTSCVMTCSSNPSRIELIEAAGRSSEEVLVAVVS